MRDTLVLVLGKSATALYAVRELSARGVEIAVEDKFSITSVSNNVKFYVNSRHNADTFNESERLESLLSFAKQSPVIKKLIIPCSDADVEFVSNNSDRLAEFYIIQQSIASDLAVNIMDKAKLARLCDEHHIIMPKFWVKKVEELPTLLKQVDYPCIIKPTMIHEVKSLMAGRKLWTISSKDEFKAVINKLPIGNTDWLVQELIPGPDSNIRLYAGYFNSRGECQLDFTADKLRQFPPGFGSASLVKSRDEIKLKEVCNTLSESISYKGIIAAEFKLDPRDNTLKMIEINTRPSLWFSITTASSIELCYAMYEDLVHGKLDVNSEQIDGVIWKYYLKDLYSKIFYKLNKNFILGVPTVDYNSIKTVYPVYSSSDVSPLLFELKSYLGKVFKRLLKR